MDLTVLNYTFDNRYYFKTPELADEGCSGYDLYASFLDNEQKFFNLLPGQRTLVHTNLFMSIPKGYEGQVRSKSGLALKSGIQSHLGTIDSSYRGELGVILFNLSHETFRIEEGMKIAQIVFQKIEQPEFILVDDLDSSSRGEGGFGSTGLK